MGGEPVAISHAQAAGRAERIRGGLRSLTQLAGDVKDAWEQADWRQLGYRSWADYCRAEFGEERLGLSRSQVREIAETLAGASMSARAIAAVAGVAPSTITRHLGRVANATPAGLVNGADGKKYPRMWKPPKPRGEQRVADAAEWAARHAPGLTDAVETALHAAAAGVPKKDAGKFAAEAAYAAVAAVFDVAGQRTLKPSDLTLMFQLEEMAWRLVNRTRTKADLERLVADSRYGDLRRHLPRIREAGAMVQRWAEAAESHLASQAGP